MRTGDKGFQLGYQNVYVNGSNAKVARNLPLLIHYTSFSPAYFRPSLEEYVWLSRYGPQHYTTHFIIQRRKKIMVAPVMDYNFAWHDKGDIHKADTDLSFMSTESYAGQNKPSFPIDMGIAGHEWLGST